MKVANTGTVDYQQGCGKLMGHLGSPLLCGWHGLCEACAEAVGNGPTIEQQHQALKGALSPTTKLHHSGLTLQQIARLTPKQVSRAAYGMGYEREFFAVGTRCRNCGTDGRRLVSEGVLSGLCKQCLDDNPEYVEEIQKWTGEKG